MSVHTSRRHTVVRRAALPLGVTAVVLLIAPSAAVADPPHLNRDPCAELLARAATWPGGFVEESGTTHRLVSDAYVSYLADQPPCTSGV